jgi:hypothetical protein
MHRRHLAALFLPALLLGLSTAGRAEENPFARTLLRGQVTTGVTLHGQRPMMRSSTLRPWLLDIKTHPHPGSAAAAKIVHFDSPSMHNAQNKPRVDGAGDTIRFEAKVRWKGDGAPPFGVALHTDANRPGEGFHDYSMKLVGQSGDQLHYAIDLPIESAGNYRAKPVVVKDGKAVAWGSGNDFFFRPYFREHDRIHEKLVNIGNIGTQKYGTFEDMLGQELVPNRGGKYTLRWMHRQGVTAVRLLPFKSNAGSPYSATSMMDVWVEYSKPAKQIRDRIDHLRSQNPDGAGKARIAAMECDMYKAALKSLRGFVDAAHKKGIRVFVDYIANHTGPDVRMLDVFFADSQGRQIDIFDPGKKASRFEVRLNDPRQIAACEGRGDLAQVLGRMKENARRGRPLSLQKVAPHLFGKWKDPCGAQHEGEIADGGWFEWPKPHTWQLNHGCQREGYHWFDVSQTAQTRATRRYVLRDMAFLVMLGIDGFRLDHLTGMPKDFLDKDMNRLQMVASRYRPGVQLFLNGEDFHRTAFTAPRTDAIELGAEKAVMGAQGVKAYRKIVDAEWRQKSTHSVGNHDEGGGIHKMGGNTLALARMLALNAAIGGPDGSKMLDELADRKPMDHRNLTFKPWGLFNTNDEMQWVARVDGQAGRAKRSLPALWGRQHDWMHKTDGKWSPDAVVAARYRDKNDHQLAIVASNFHGEQGQSGTFKLTPGAVSRLKDQALYQVFNYMDNPRHPLWKQPIPGWQLKRDGIYIGLKPSETQILDLREVQRTGSGYRRVGRDAPALYTIGHSLLFE